MLAWTMGREGNALFTNNGCPLNLLSVETWCCTCDRHEISPRIYIIIFYYIIVFIIIIIFIFFKSKL